MKVQIPFLAELPFGQESSPYRIIFIFFSCQNLPKGAAMSVARCVVGTFTSIVCTALLGYIVTIKHFAGRKFMRIVMIITMYFGGG